MPWMLHSMLTSTLVRRWTLRQLSCCIPRISRLRPALPPQQAGKPRRTSQVQILTKSAAQCTASRPVRACKASTGTPPQAQLLLLPHRCTMLTVAAHPSRLCRHRSQPLWGLTGLHHTSTLAVHPLTREVLSEPPRLPRLRACSCRGQPGGRSERRGATGSGRFPRRAPAAQDPDAESAAGGSQEGDLDDEALQALADAGDDELVELQDPGSAPPAACRVL